MDAATRRSTAPPSPHRPARLALDAAYSPIMRVAYNVEMSRLGKITDYEKLVLEVWTNGSVSPDERAHAGVHLPAGSLPPAGRRRAARGRRGETGAEGEAFLRDAPRQDARGAGAAGARDQRAQERRAESGGRPRAEERGRDLEHVKNLGEKSIDEIKTALAALGLSLGMRIDPNVLGALGRGSVKRADASAEMIAEESRDEAPERRPQARPAHPASVGAVSQLARRAVPSTSASRPPARRPTRCGALPST